MSLTVTFGDIVIMRLMLSASVLFIVSVCKQTTFFLFRVKYTTVVQHPHNSMFDYMHNVDDSLRTIHNFSETILRLRNIYNFRTYVQCDIQMMRWCPCANVLMPSEQTKRLSSKPERHVLLSSMVLTTCFSERKVWNLHVDLVLALFRICRKFL